MESTEKVHYQRRDSAELALEKKSSSSIARFKETKRKTSGRTSVSVFEKIFKNFSKISFSFLKTPRASDIHDLFYAPNRPSQKSVDYFQNRPRTADTYRTNGHERTPSNSSTCSNASNMSQQGLARDKKNSGSLFDRQPIP